MHRFSLKIIHRFICTKTLHFTGEATEIEKGKIWGAESHTFDFLLVNISLAPAMRQVLGQEEHYYKQFSWIIRKPSFYYTNGNLWKNIFSDLKFKCDLLFLTKG